MNFLIIPKAVDDKPLRQRAEVMIWREGKVLVAHAIYGARTCYSLPGGGIDAGEDPITAAARESLEEVGVSIKNARLSPYTSISPIGPTISWKEGRSYSGNFTYLVIADFDCINEEHKGCEGDAMTYVWMTPAEAYAAFSKTHNTGVDRCEPRLKELQQYM